MNAVALATQRDRLLARLNAVAAECGENFPLHAAEPGQPWRVSEGGSWTGGFWTACHWLRAALTDSAADQAKAAALCHRLAAKLHASTGHRAFLFWYGAALGERWCGDAAAAQLARAAARALGDAWSDELGAIPLGTTLGGGPGGDARISIDALAPTLLLLHHHGDDIARGKARRHAQTLLRVCGDGQGAFHAEAEWSGGRWHPAGLAGDWSRGQAWALLGLSTSAALWNDDYFWVQADAAARYWLRTRGEFPPPFRLHGGDSAIPDPVAAVIAARAFVTMARQDARWVGEAQRVLEAVLASPWLIASEAHGRPCDRFVGCCLTSPGSAPMLAETPWGTFLLVDLLHELADATHIVGNPREPAAQTDPVVADCGENSPANVALPLCWFPTGDGRLWPALGRSPANVALPLCWFPTGDGRLWPALGRS